MTVKEIKAFVMHQHLDMDMSDVDAYIPFLLTYINEGYDKLVKAWANRRVGETDCPILETDNDSPKIPERYHKALCDWATWCLYRNGNQQKQGRGQAYRYAFEEALTDILNAGGEAAAGDADGDGLVDRTGMPVEDIRHFHGIPR